MTKLSTLLAASAAAGALALAGCGNSEEEPQIEDAQQTSQAEDTESADDAGGDDAAANEKGGSLEAAQAAIDLAEKEIGGKAIEIDFDDEKTWELTVLKGSEKHEVEINAEGTEIVKKEKDDDQAEREDVDALKKAKTSLKDALKKAIDEQAGTIDEADLDTDGEPTWSVEIYPEGKTDSVDVYVSAINGSIVDEPADD
ncbi:PepSY domain-containing protein [Brevibacterium ravenspurgense]|uniref:PepSY domain-containing protein n=1 Tax=Brevibacterium ravenspurgense TaxID=479117 RepID=UPI0002D47076|nr:PepSY domain-containing protein [Brevibacterium ravenspurgense]